ncbi:MAG: outer membrane beta-barrel protein [Bacteroidia bacterium]|nr:outer membrane beta-barrel protein [Bacteroidia bacterium]
MKRILTILLLVITVLINSTEAQAQFFKANVQLGANFSQIDGDHIGGYNKVGLNGGIGIFHEIDDFKSYGFEIKYAQKGSRLVNDPDAAVQPIFIIKSSYVEFPITFRYTFPSYDFLNVETGLSVGVNVGGTIDDGPRVTDANFNTIEVAYLLGATYLFNEHLGFRVRHAYSVNRIGLNFPNSRRWFNRVGMFNRLFEVGLVYNLK